MILRFRHASSDRRGYILLTVVVIIAVSMLMLTRIASSSLRSASHAVETEKSVRHQWATTSIRRMALDAAPKLLNRLSQANEGDSENPYTLWKDIELAGESWRVVVADESAKLNVGLFSKTSNPDEVTACLQQLSTGGIGLRPSSDFDPMATRWDHWFDRRVVNQRRSSASAEQLATATQRVTLWGDGKLNVCRCAPETLDFLWRSQFGRPAPPELHELRSATPTPTIAHLIGSLALRESEAKIAWRWLTTESSCYSVWIFCNTDRRVPASFFVEWGGQATTDHRGYEY